MQKRKVEIFTSGCPICESTVDLVNKLSCPSCEIIIYDLNKDNKRKFETRQLPMGLKEFPLLL